MRARWLGRVPYLVAEALQERLVLARRNAEIPDTLLLLEHPPVVTLGRGADPSHLLQTEEDLRAAGIDVHACGRGGDVTYHGPGQLVGYPILALEAARRDARRYLRDLEEAVIRTVREHGIEARRDPGLTGVWVGERKIAAIGVRIGTGWITSHGFALNVSTDLAGFETIVPCGIRGREVTSIARETGRDVPLREVAARAAVHLAAVLGRSLDESLGATLPSPA